MFRYIRIILREFQSCTSLKLRSFYIIKISLKLSDQNINVVFFIKRSLYDFYSIICIISMFTCPYVHLDIMQ
jgi:hypothetical protein